MKKLECRFWIFVSKITGTPEWAEMYGHAVGWWKSRLKMLIREEIEERYRRRFLNTHDIFGDDRSKGFDYFVMLQKEKNEELSKL